MFSTPFERSNPFIEALNGSQRQVPKTADLLHLKKTFFYNKTLDIKGNEVPPFVPLSSIQELMNICNFKIRSIKKQHFEKMRTVSAI